MEVWNYVKNYFLFFNFIFLKVDVTFKIIIGSKFNSNSGF